VFWFFLDEHRSGSIDDCRWPYSLAAEEHVGFLIEYLLGQSRICNCDDITEPENR
jgi:hypothetical protein